MSAATAALQATGGAAVCVSRIDPRKGVRFLPEAMTVLRERGLEPSLEVLGPTVGRLGEAERAATLAAAERLGLADRVQFSGAASIEQVYAAYAEHDLLLVPSLPGEVPESAAGGDGGRPAGCRDPGGRYPDLVQDGRNGLLVPPADGEALGQAATRRCWTPSCAPPASRAATPRLARTPPTPRPSGWPG